MTDEHPTCTCRTRRTGPSGWAGVILGGLALFVACTGTAVAASGGHLVLGRNNTASATTTLTDTSGTPLKIVGSTSAPPLSVNSPRKVKQLNSDLLDGLDSTAFALKTDLVPTRYFEGQGAPDALPTLTNEQQTVVQKDLPAGLFLVTITGRFVDVTSPATSTCGVELGDVDLVELGMPYPRWQAVVTSTPSTPGALWLSGPLRLTDPSTTVSLRCRTSDPGGTVLEGPATIQALQVASVDATRSG